MPMLPLGKYVINIYAGCLPVPVILSEFCSLVLRKYYQALEKVKKAITNHIGG